VEAVGPERVGFRLSPWNTYQEMRMENPIPQFSDLIHRLKALRLAYLHLIEPRVAGPMDKLDWNRAESNDPFISIWGHDSPVILAGGFNADNIKGLIDGKYRHNHIAFAFGRYFVSTPDLVYRLRKGIPLAKYNRSTFYKFKSPEGYIDYPFSAEWESETAQRSVENGTLLGGMD
jgi:NADPH2 dehydrogenase